MGFHGTPDYYEDDVETYIYMYLYSSFIPGVCRPFLNVHSHGYPAMCTFMVTAVVDWVTFIIRRTELDKGQHTMPFKTAPLGSVCGGNTKARG